MRFDSPGIRVSALARDVDDDAVIFSYAPGEVQKTASIGKIFLLHTVLALVEEGQLSLSDPITRIPSDTIADSGLWYLLQVDTLSVYDLCALIGAVSDNHATNTLLRVVGIDEVARRTRALGYERTGLWDRVREERGPGMPPTLSSGNATDLCDVAVRLARRELGTPESSDVLRRWLAAGADCSMVLSGYNLDPLAHDFFDRELWAINKTGTVSTVRADVGIVASPERRVAYAVLTEWDADADRRDDALALMRDAGLEIARYVRGGFGAP